jgi:YD repeat-containing protein
VTTASYDSKGNQRVVVNHNPFSIQQFSLAYDANGQLTAVTNAPDANGRSRVDTFSWSQGQVTQCVVDASAGGLALTSAFEYDARGNLTRVIDPRTNDWLFTYNALDQLVQASSALVTANGSLSTFRTATQFAYDANDNLMQCSTQLGDGTGKINRVRVDNYQYDGEDRLSQVALAVDDTHALTNGYAYDGNDQCVQVLGGDAVSGADPNQTAAFQYDERGLLLHATAAPGTALCGTNEYSYDANGCLEKVKLRQGVKVEIDNAFVHDGFGRLASVTDPMGNQTVCFYDANDNPKVVRLFGELNDVPGSAGNVRLAESDYQYDGLDRCVSAKDLFFNPATQAAIGSGQSLTTCAYAPNDECVSVTDTLGHTTTYGYDTACRPVSVTDALGNQQNVVYDAGGNPLVEISSEIQAASGKPQVLAVTNVYDALNRCVSTTDSAGNTSRYAYDSLDRCVQTIDPRGVYAFYSYDFLDRCTVAIGDLNGDGFPDFIHDITTTFSWSSSSGNLLAVTDSNTNTTSYAYDSLGRCLTVTHADGTQEQMTWDPRSNLIWKQDANGTTIANLYDYSDRLVHRDIAARTAAGVAATTTFETFTYDGCDRLTGAANDGGTTAFAYDSLDDCVSETLNGITTTSTYDALGNRLSLTYPGGRALTYTYDALNRCASISDSGQQLVSYTYDGPDRVSQVTYGNGTRTQIAYDGFAGKPNATGDYGFGQISRVRHGIVASGVVIDDRTFSYDPDQNKTSRNLTAPFTLGGAAQAMFFQYDPANRLVDSLVTTNGAVARLTTYGLDRMGNRTNVTGAASCSGDYFLSSILPPGDFQMNRYTTTPCDARTYDSDGNLVGVSSAAGPLTYQYDYVGRLVLVQALNSGTGTLAPVASYDYDAVGRRMHKTVYSGGLPPATTQFLYDGSSVIEERNGTTTAATYVSAGAKSDGRPAYLNFSCVYNEIRLGGHDYFVHTDDQGNTLALTGANGAVMERYDYDDYGAVTFLTSDGTTTSATSSAVGNPYCWGGLRLDAETGLQTDDGGGYFEPQTGRELDGTPHVPVLPVPMWPSGFFSENNPWSGGSPLFNKEKPKPTNNEGKKEFVGHVSILK